MTFTSHERGKTPIAPSDRATLRAIDGRPSAMAPVSQMICVKMSIGQVTLLVERLKRAAADDRCSKALCHVST